MNENGHALDVTCSRLSINSTAEIRARLLFSYVGFDASPTPKVQDCLGFGLGFSNLGSHKSLLNQCRKYESPMKTKPYTTLQVILDPKP